MADSKKFVQNIPCLGPGLTWLWHKYRSYDQNPGRRLRKVFAGARNIQVVQIGSNDGRTGDPICDLLKINPSWQALFVEPVPYLFRKLQGNYGPESRFRYENLAVSEKSDSLPFYYLEENARDDLPDLPEWYNQLGSFNPDHILEHFGDQARSFIKTIHIDTLPLATVLERNNITRIDLLHIDTEGADWEILRQLDLQRFTPQVILVEHNHLAPETKLEVRRFLQDRYTIAEFSHDYFCRKRPA